MLAGAEPPERGGKVTLRKNTRLVYVEQEPSLPAGALAEEFIYSSDAPAVTAARKFREAAEAAEAAAEAVAAAEAESGDAEAREKGATALEQAQAALARASDGMEASGGWLLQEKIEVRYK